jgi:hypothetical protein
VSFCGHRELGSGHIARVAMRTALEMPSTTGTKSHIIMKEDDA